MIDQAPNLDYDNAYIELMLSYHENSKLRPVYKGGFEWEELADAAVATMEGVNAPYSFLPKLELDEGTVRETEDGRKACWRGLLQKRRSTRTFSGAALELRSALRLLLNAAGPTGSQLYCNPTAGNLRSAQVIFLHRSSEVGTGRSGYQRLGFDGSALRDMGFAEKSLVHACFSDVPSGVAGIIVIYSRLARVVFKYGMRGYRYCLLDAGHLMQNIYLSATILGIPMYSSCGFFDNELNHLLGLDGQRESAAYVAFVGAPVEGKEVISAE